MKVNFGRVESYNERKEDRCWKRALSLKRVIRGEKNVRRTDRDGDRGKKETHGNIYVYRERDREREQHCG